MSKKLARQIGLKVFASGKQVSDAQLTMINGYALEPLSLDQVYVRRYVVAHNGIDRDNERFSEDLLDQFAATLPGKGMFLDGHPGGWNGNGAPGSGRWFAAGVETMSPAEFKTLTGEEINLPEGIEQAKVAWGESYLLKDLENMAEWIKLIDAGIVTFISIGFKAARNAVTDEHGNYKYAEYGPNGEALEASLVWLGAQPGASAKALGTQPEPLNPLEEEKQMKAMLKTLGSSLGLQTTLTEENLVTQVKTLVDQKDSDLTAKQLELDGLKASAADGVAYRKSLVEDALRFGTLIDEVPSDEAGQKSEGDFMMSLPIERLKMLRGKYEKRAREEHPTHETFVGKDATDLQQQNATAQQNGQQNGQQQSGRKDYTDPANNELIATLGR